MNTNTNTNTNTYRNQGDVRGRCPHTHRTIAGAVRCLVADMRGCERQGGYSDRRVVPSDPAEDTLDFRDAVDHEVARAFGRR